MYSNSKYICVASQFMPVFVSLEYCFGKIADRLDKHFYSTLFRRWNK